MHPLTKNKFFPFFIAIPLFFCFHSYRGIVLDAILYLLQYVSTFDPQRFASDPAFAFGNQDSYGFFSPILGVFIESLGVDLGMKTLCWLSHLGWVLSAVFLVRAFCKYSYNKLWFIPFLILFIVFTADGMPHTKVHFFRLVEHYTCSRAISIIFGFAGLAALLQKKRNVSLLFFLFGTIIHPLTAGWGLPLWLSFFFPKTRAPLLVFSALFPFLAFLHIGKFDFYPLDWLRRPLAFLPPSDMIVRNCVWFVFYGLLVPRFFPSSPLEKLGKSILYVTLIAFYWNLWGGFGEHIFLYQVQTWRAEWIPSIFSILYGFILIVQLVKNIRRKKIHSFDYSKFWTVIAILSPTRLLLPAIAAFFLVRKKNFCLDETKYAWACFAYFIVSGFMVQQYVIWCSEGGTAFLGFDYHYLYRLQNSLLLNQALFALVCIVLLIRKKKFIWILPLGTFLFLPQYQLLPLLVIVWFGIKSPKKLILIAVVVLTILDCVNNTNYREHSLFNSLPSSFYLYGGLAILSVAALKMTAKFSKNSPLFFVPIILLLTILVAYAYTHWDGRDNTRIEVESKLNGYLKETIFPQATDRGRILFYVKGPLETDPRLQFLSGAYLGESSRVGELFFEGQYKEVLKRGDLLFYKELRGVPHGESVFVGFVEKKMLLRDTLVDRVQFLCEEKMIDNLISSEKALPFEKKDSVLYDKSEWIYLYGCP